MPRSPAWLHLAHGVACLAWLSASCTPNQRITQSGTNMYRIRCNTALSTCLEQAEFVCPQGFDLREAKEDRERQTPSGSGTSVVVERQSEGLIVCRSKALINLNEAAPPPWDDERVCAPGATQECTGGGGCRGGQSCLLDGSGFSPCDCVLGPPVPPLRTSDVDAQASDAQPGTTPLGSEAPAASAPPSTEPQGPVPPQGSGLPAQTPPPTTIAPGSSTATPLPH